MQHACECENKLCTNIHNAQMYRSHNFSHSHSDSENKDTWGWGQKHTLTWTQTQTGGLPYTSGVTSRGAKPVPPVVRIKLSSFSSHQSTSVSFNTHTHTHTEYQHKTFSSNSVVQKDTFVQHISLKLLVQHHISYFGHIVWPDK